jgi:hypothetical protein
MSLIVDIEIVNCCCFVAIYIYYKLCRYKYRDIKNYHGQRWSWIGKRPSQLISCDDFFGSNEWPTSTFFMSHTASSAKQTTQFVRHA